MKSMLLPSRDKEAINQKILPGTPEGAQRPASKEPRSMRKRVDDMWVADIANLEGLLHVSDM